MKPLMGVIARISSALQRASIRNDTYDHVSLGAPLPRVMARERSDRSNPKSLASVRPIAHNAPHYVTQGAFRTSDQVQRTLNVQCTSERPS
jgi:hypothetical protein